MMSHTQPRKESSSGLEPQLGDSASAVLTGYEPILGGLRRPGADMSRVMALVNTSSEQERQSLLNYVIRLGQAPVYARELAQVVPAYARQKVGSWHGTFTPSQRQIAIDTLAQIGSYEAILPLIDALNDAQSRIREAAGRALPQVCARFDPDDQRTRIVYQALVDALRKLRLSGRQVVTTILKDADPDLILEPLLMRGLSAHEWWARRESAWTLGAVGDRRAVRRLIAMLEDSSSAVRISAAWALGEIDAPVVLDPLAEAYREERDEVVRASLVTALGEQIARLDITGEEFLHALPDLAAALKDTDLAVRHAAEDALGEINAPEARRVLEKYYEAE